MKFVNTHNISKMPNLRRKKGGAYRGMKGLLEVMSFEVLAESILQLQERRVYVYVYITVSYISVGLIS